ncbi:hypothetical protein J6590_063376 [Homalodisca vitripennis]|nr:hypothetical protein J6590_063376 [Homalodisca vitripennis]
MDVHCTAAADTVSRLRPQHGWHITDGLWTFTARLWPRLCQGRDLSTAGTCADDIALMDYGRSLHGCGRNCVKAETSARLAHVQLTLKDYGRSLHGCGRDCVKAETSARLAHVQLISKLLTLTHQQYSTDGLWTFTARLWLRLCQGRDLSTAGTCAADSIIALMDYGRSLHGCGRDCVKAETSARLAHYRTDGLWTFTARLWLRLCQGRDLSTAGTCAAETDGLWTFTARLWLRLCQGRDLSTAGTCAADIALMDYGRSLHGCGRDCVKAEISARLAHVQLTLMDYGRSLHGCGRDCVKAETSARLAHYSTDGLWTFTARLWLRLCQGRDLSTAGTCADDSIELMDYGRSLHGCGRDCVKAEISARLAHVQLSK